MQDVTVKARRETKVTAAALPGISEISADFARTSLNMATIAKLCRHFVASW
jgi:hypothetical protein